MCMNCSDCNTPIIKTEAYAVKDKTGAPLCLDCADSYYSVTIVDAGEIIEGASTWTGDGPHPVRKERA